MVFEPRLERLPSVIGSSFHRAFAAHRRADGHYLLYESDRDKRNNR